MQIWCQAFSHLHPSFNINIYLEKNFEESFADRSRFYSPQNISSGVAIGATTEITSLQSQQKYLEFRIYKIKKALLKSLSAALLSAK